MKLIRSLFLSSLLLTVIFITGCNEGPTTSVDPINTGVQLSKFSLPPGVDFNFSNFAYLHYMTLRTMKNVTY